MRCLRWSASYRATALTAQGSEAARKFCGDDLGRAALAARGRALADRDAASVDQPGQEALVRYSPVSFPVSVRRRSDWLLVLHRSVRPGGSSRYEPPRTTKRRPEKRKVAGSIPALATIT
ncbi:hypothetical protein GCM10009754_71970 [Amycolatopsis minnesotensis]|uniref:Uncharacterized protein n=1 Tax=Amycolatopsis minnesotensis TaxID=337894 RepID=A0ABP5DPY1_9PSEU